MEPIHNRDISKLYLQDGWDRDTSLPSGSPLPNVAVKPTNFAISVLNVKWFSIGNPRNIVFTSGIPDPLKKTSVKAKDLLAKSNLPTLCGANILTKVTANNINIVGNAIQQMYERNGDVVKSRYNQIRAEDHSIFLLNIPPNRFQKLTIRTQYDTLINTNRKQCHKNSK